MFKTVLQCFILVFFDNILIYSHSWTAHLAHLHKVFSLLRLHSLFVKKVKCEFESIEIDYLSHHISGQGVTVYQSKISIIHDWPIPNVLRNLRSFYGLTGYYRRFVHQYATLANPLTNILYKDAFNWNEAAMTVFHKLKEAMTTTPSYMAIPSPSSANNCPHECAPFPHIA